jgi:acyl dehydratase
VTDIGDLEALGGRIGEEIAVTDWVEISQARIDQFAEATGDRQWIHVDTARAARESPYRTTVAHGFLTLSMASMFIRGALGLSGVKMGINYGLNRVRFIAAVPAGSRIRGRISLRDFERRPEGAQVVWGVVVEREGSDKPCAVVEWIVRYYEALGQ